MDKEFLKEVEQKLKEEKEKTEKALKEIAKKENGKWEVIFPVFNGGESGGGILEKGADEVEEYSTLLSLKDNLVYKLKEIEIALEKLKKGNYGICEKCKKEIEKERLKIFPEARYCLECKEKFKL
jgi:DnaK suppressor protein